MTEEKKNQIMTQYIDKDALVTEINRLLNDEFQCSSYDEATGFQNALDLIKSFIDTIEVKTITEQSSKELEEAVKEDCILPENCNDGANWQKQQMIKSAFDSKIIKEDESGNGNSEDLNILQRFSFYSYKDEPNILYLAGLYVNDEYRNKGVGTKILKVANEVALGIGCHVIRLKTQKDTNAERFYRKNGYNILTDEGNQTWLEKQSTLQVRTGLEWINTVDDACDKRYSEEYAHGEYCHRQSFKWGFQEGVEWFEEQVEQKPQSARDVE